MGSVEDAVTQQRMVDARARNISHSVRCTECGSLSIEDSQADIAILLRKLIRDEIRSGKSDKEIYKKLEEEYGVHHELLGANEVEFSVEEWEGAAAEWTWSLVGLVFGSKPSLGKMSSFVKSRWGDEGMVKVGQLDQGIFIFNFSSELARDRVVDAGPWMFDNRPLVLKIWSPDEHYSLNSVTSLLIWVRFPRLGVHLRRGDMLSKIASLVGRPIRTDSFTQGKTKLEYARALVEVFATNELKHSVIVRGPRGVSFVQRVEYDWLPERCCHCQSFGHSVQKCKIPRVEVGDVDGENEKLCD